MKRDELRKMLPHGALKKVAALAGVTPVSVSRYFKNEFDSYKIEIAALQIANEYEKNKKDLIKGLIS